MLHPSPPTSTALTADLQFSLNRVVGVRFGMGFDVGFGSVFWIGVGWVVGRLGWALFYNVGEPFLHYSDGCGGHGSRFLDKLSKISLTEDEELDIAMRITHRKEILEECSLSVLRRFTSDKPINPRAAKNLLCSVWRLGNDLKIVELGEGLLQFKFSLETQLKWVIDNGPWCFDNHLLVLRRWEKEFSAINVSFPSIQLWVQVWGLPFDLMNDEAGREIGSGLGEVLDVDVKL
ncbi:hypothetical protein SO802_005881 [Lithocarpus litseifolius]|uniref:DUF4283 domain-containing protein n=1 Tax=Lithocarpus litseifolius TaxID=425828 RepID=A0AAW2DJE5_9ROSI